MLEAAVLNERWESVAGTHRRANSIKPRVFWAPDESSLASGELRSLFAYWRKLRGDKPMPRQDQIDPLDMRDALGFLFLMDVVDGGADFRYRVYGSKVVDRYSVDMTGKLLSNLKVDSVFVDFFMAGYRAVVARKIPLLTQHNHSPFVAATDTVRLILPLANDKGEVGRILVGNIPGEWRPPTRLEPPQSKRISLRTS
ncbi:MAG: PAS domain-containing protein [Elsteraceae bacterium]